MKREQANVPNKRKGGAIATPPSAEGRSRLLEIETRADCGLIALIKVGSGVIALIVKATDHCGKSYAWPERITDAELVLVEGIVAAKGRVMIVAVTPTQADGDGVEVVSNADVVDGLIAVSAIVRSVMAIEPPTVKPAKPTLRPTAQMLGSLEPPVSQKPFE